MPARTTTLAIICAAAALAGALPGAAHATTLAEESGSRLRVTAEAGRVNDITAVRLVAGVVEITDGGDRVVPGSGCAGVDADTVHCQAGVTSLGIDAGDLDDRVVTAAPIAEVFVSGSDGADWLQVTGDFTVISGGTGSDTLLGVGRDNVLDGGPGGDVLDGSGTTWADYSARTAPVRVTIDGVADDGEAGEGDDVRPGAGFVLGGSANDTLIGDGRSNRLVGGFGDDELSGEHGRRDVLIGGEGDDTLDGGDGRDDLIGGAGDDKHDGGAASDRLIAEPGDGDDIYAGGSGDGDEVSYAQRSTWVFVDIDGVQDDGGSGERDDVGADVELVTGGDGDDTIRGSGAVNYLRGGPGRDSLNALGGDDYLDGGPGGDALAGGGDRDRLTYESRRSPVRVTLDGSADDGEANERDNVAPDVEDIFGGEGNDILIGGPGPNVLDGAGGDDSLTGLDGADLLRGDLGADRLRGGLGNDVLQASDNVAGNDLLNGEGDVDACDSDPGDMELACES